jgi:hypothetical protein
MAPPGSTEQASLPLLFKTYVSLDCVFIIILFQDALLKIALPEPLRISKSNTWYNEDMRKITLKWLKQAEADLKAALDSLKTNIMSGPAFKHSRVEKKP